MKSMYNPHFTEQDRIMSPSMMTCVGCGTKYLMHKAEVPVGVPFYCTNFPACAEKREQVNMGDFKVTETGYEGDPNEIMAYAKSDVNDAQPADDSATGQTPADPNASDLTAPKDEDGNPVPPTPPIEQDQLTSAAGAESDEKPEYVENHDVVPQDDGIDKPLDENPAHQIDDHTAAEHQ